MKPGSSNANIFLAALAGCLVLLNILGLRTFGRFDGAEPRNGELFSVEVFAADGSSVAARSGAVQYERVQPNGPDCDPTCMQGELK